MEYNKRVAKLSDAYNYYFQAAISLKYFLFKKNMSGDFIENIMLAVTEVNGCKICSVAHAKMALESGMNEEEISDLLKNDNQKIKKEYLVAVLFSKEYASENAKPSAKSLNYLKEVYPQRFNNILAVIRMIMLGNTYGIAYDTFKRRLKGEKIAQNIWRDLIILMGYILLIPAFILVFIISLIIN